MSEERVMRMYYDKTQANTPVSLADWDHLSTVLPFQMDFWLKKVEQKEAETKKDYYQRVVQTLVENTDDEVILRLNSEGRVGTLNLLSNPDTPANVKAELRKNLGKFNNKSITCGQGTIAFLKGTNPEELRKIQAETIRVHLQSMREDEKRQKRAMKMNVH